MASEQIVLFDIPTKAPRTTWSLNPWKSKLLLAYKGLDYRTEWLEYPDIKARLQNHVTPSPDGTYTIPTIILPNGTYITDSLVIAQTLNTLYPSPPLRITTPALAWFTANYGTLMTHLRGIYIPHIPRRLLDPASHAYWHRTRSEACGMSLDELEATCGGDKAWEMAGPLLRQVTGMLEEEEGGPFFEGDEVSYADFVWVGLLLFFEKMGADVFERLLEASGNGEVHVRLMRVCEERGWSRRRD